MCSAVEARVSICPCSSLTDPVSVYHSSAQRPVKGEDVLFEHEEGGYRLFAVCDGHHGRRCATFVKNHFWTQLKQHLPTLPVEEKEEEAFQILADIRKAMVEAFMNVDDIWYREDEHSGTTLTVALLTGRLLTVANVGDSLGFVHDGRNFFEVSKNHRLDCSPSEKHRLEKSGMQLAPLCASLHGPARAGDTGYGPLRVWPGGLAVSRSIGDADVTPHVLCIPHVHQLLIPQSGARLVLASDGLWDVLHPRRVKRVLKHKRREDCAEKLAEIVSRVRGGDLDDDLSLTVVDVVAKDAACQDFKLLRDAIIRTQPKSRLKSVVQSLRRKRCKGEIASNNADHFLADVDGITLVPKHLHERHMDAESPAVADITPAEFTVNGAHRLRGIVYNP